MWLWFRSTQEGQIKRKNGSIFLQDDLGVPHVWWNFYNAWPVEWQGPSMDSRQSLVASQRIVLAHEGVKKTVMAAAYGAAAGTVYAVVSRI